MPPATVGPMPSELPYTIGAVDANIIRLVSIILNGPGDVSALDFYAAGCSGGVYRSGVRHVEDVPLAGSAMALFAAGPHGEPSGPLLGRASGYDVCPGGRPGWATALLPSAVHVPDHNTTMWIAHWYAVSLSASASIITTTHTYIYIYIHAAFH